ncbi:MAG: endonuclease [Clostridia bacterium]|nr:endonuclease [Clostridia bacterium]
MHHHVLRSRLLSLFTALVMICGVLSFLALPSSAAPSLPAVNTEKRHEKDCTALSSDALAYYTGDYAYAKLSELSGAKNNLSSANAALNNDLYDALQELMSTTHTFKTSYSGTGAGSLAYYWQRTDAQNGVSGSFVLFYSDNVVGVNNSSAFNREHVWPKSNASFNQSNGGADLHHLRPANPNVNSARGNLPFGNVKGVYSGATQGSCYYKTGTLFEPADNVKGDVARILLYVYVRWGENNLYSDTANGSRIIESLQTLLDWNKLDPVDTWEMKRNDLTEDVQGNRNVFIDYPELAYKLFSKSVPTGIVTPSGSAYCAHSWTLTSETPATCTEQGERNYCCTLCSATKTEYDEPKGHRYTVDSETAPTCTEPGVTVSVCTVCRNEKTVTQPALGHVDANGNGLCDRCGAKVPKETVFEAVTQVTDGMHLYIGHPSQGKVLTATASGTKLLGTPATVSGSVLTPPEDGALFVVRKTGDHFYLINNGKYLTTVEKGNALKLTDAADAYSLWRLEPAGNGAVYIYSVNAAYQAGNYNQALEYYSGGYTVYGQKANDNYLFRLYAVSGHVWDEGTVTVPAEPGHDGTAVYTCTLCGEQREETLPAPASYDLNGDGHTDITDVTALLDALSSGRYDASVHDLDQDGFVMIADVTFLLDRLASKS